MKFSIVTSVPGRIVSDCLVSGVFTDGKMSAATAALDKASHGAIKAVLAQGDLDGKAGSTLVLHRVAGVSAKRLMLVGMGKPDELSDKVFIAALRSVVKAVKGTGARDVVFLAEGLPCPKHGDAWRARQIALVLEDACYQKGELKSEPGKALPLKAVSMAVGKKTQAVQQALEEGKAIARGQALTKRLGDLPANHCTPRDLALAARTMAREHGLACKVLGSREIAKLGMGSFLSVSQGSAQPPRFIVVEYRGAGRKVKPIVLVGKGVTFDSGGISLKPGAEMDEMKFDMCGAASVLGTLKACALMKLKLNVVGLIPATENMPGGRATKPGDVVKSMSGQTIEILNTDAEGRLILCDALTYAARYEPQVVVDIATLTGAVVVALGSVVSGLIANDDGLAGELEAAGLASYDRAWRLPMYEEYQDLLKSNFADIPNISGGRWAGAITAGCFLSRFTKTFKWAHLDIAGTAWDQGTEKGATGRPVPLLTHFLMQRAGKKLDPQ